MLRQFAIAVFLLVPLNSWAIVYRSLEPGLEYAAFEPGNLPGTKIHLLKVDLKNFSVRVIDARELKSKALPVKSMAEKTQALAVINANFFDEDQKPLGLVLQKGAVKIPPRNVSWWAALLIGNHHAKIAKVYSTEAVQGYQEGLQAGPRLVVSGSTPRLKTEISAKSAVGIDRKGNLVLLVSEGILEINELAKILATPEKRGGVGLPHALNLDGGSSTQFFARVGDWKLNLPGVSKVPVGLGVFRR